MKEICYTLLTDGSSDKALLNIIDWLFNDLAPEIPVNGEYADFSRLKNPPSLNMLNLRIIKAIELFDCDILFVHRDAENSSLEDRKNEIKSFWFQSNITKQKMIPIIPVRMTEAWLLIDEHAIKIAAGNRFFNGDINLPKVNQLQDIADPKEQLFNMIKQASDLKGRRLKKLNVHSARHIVAENIKEFSVLRQLSAFQSFENDVKMILSELGYMNSN